MKFLRIIKNKKLENNFSFVDNEKEIYRENNKRDCILSFEVEWEENDDEQYPLESILDNFRVAVNNFEYKNIVCGDTAIIEFIGDLERIEQLKELVNKRVFEVYINKFFVLKIEDLKGQ